jgi:hypothetical protein
MDRGGGGGRVSPAAICFRPCRRAGRPRHYVFWANEIALSFLPARFGGRLIFHGQPCINRMVQPTGRMWRSAFAGAQAFCD